MKTIAKVNIGLAITATVVLGSIYVVNQLNPVASTKEALLAKYDLEDKTPVEMVNHLESILDDTGDIRSSVTGTQLIIYGLNNLKFSYDLPEDQFYLSIAPYEYHTHPCGIHNLTTCRGELDLVGETFHVLVEDNVGNVVYNEDRQMTANGFIGIWLPKDLTVTVTVTYNNKTAVTDVTTFADNNTCLTEALLLS